MSLTPAALKSALAQETDEAWLVLLTITHDLLSQPIRVVNNHTSIVSNGETFIGYPFELDLPDDTPGSPRGITLRIDNVDRVIVDSLRALTSPFAAQLDVVLASAPDDLQASFPGLSAIKAEYDALVVEAELGYEDLRQEPYPGESFTPDKYPGLF